MYKFVDPEYSKKVVDDITIKSLYQRCSDLYLTAIVEFRSIIQKIKNSDINETDKNIVIDEYRKTIALMLRAYQASIIRYEKLLERNLLEDPEHTKKVY